MVPLAKLELFCHCSFCLYQGFLLRWRACDESGPGVYVASLVPTAGKQFYNESRSELHTRLPGLLEVLFCFVLEQGLM